MTVDQIGYDYVKEGFELILKGLEVGLGINIDDENFRETPDRVARAYFEMLSGADEEGVNEILSKSFPDKYDGIITVTDINVYSMCPHHFLPVNYIIHFGYMPNENVLGLSKIPRFIKLLAKAPILQETFTNKIISKFDEFVKPKGSIVYVEGKHLCMGARGIEMPSSSTITTSLSGEFGEKTLKDEFFDMIQRRKIG